MTCWLPVGPKAFLPHPTFYAAHVAAGTVCELDRYWIRRRLRIQSTNAGESVYICSDCDDSVMLLPGYHVQGSTDLPGYHCDFCRNAWGEGIEYFAAVSDYNTSPALSPKALYDWADRHGYL